ncbi:MAG: ferritin-like domain-containing protein [Rhodobacter sp.]|nr:ferritin-like domain-containing protein [Rhodobacter sp.]
MNRHRNSFHKARQRRKGLGRRQAASTGKPSSTKLTADQWDIAHLRSHLQAAVDLEFWTLPFYLSAMYSIKDRSSDAYQLIRTVVNQEMLHLQSASNIANAYGLSPTFAAPKYEGTNIPHLDFSGDDLDEIDKFKPYTATIGALDLEHVNAMCLIEIPEYLTGETGDLNENVTEYGSIGAFYDALRYGASLLTDHLHGGVKQVDFFSAYYRGMPSLKVIDDGADGFDQVSLLIDLITDQGEGATKEDETVLPAFQNTADDVAPELDHFDKFLAIKDAKELPETFKGGGSGDQLQQILVSEFTDLRAALEHLFGGGNPQQFFPVMASVGGAIRNCWENGVSPRFS